MNKPDKEWDFTASTATEFDVDSMLAKMKTLREKAKTVPTVLVMMTKTLEMLRDMNDVGASQYQQGAMPNLFTGIPVENYDTMRECMDRVMCARDGERPQLFAAVDDIGDDLFDHPFMRMQAESLKGFYPDYLPGKIGKVAWYDPS